MYTPAFFAMSFANLCCMTSYGIFFLFPLYLIDHGGTQADTGLIMGVFALTAVLFRPWASAMVDHWGRKRSYTIGSVVLALIPLAYLPFRGVLDSFYLALLLVRMVHGIAYAVAITAAFTYITDITPLERLNEGIGMFGLSGLVGTAVGPALSEFVIRRSGFGLLFVLAAGISCLGFLAHLPIRESMTKRVRGLRSDSFYAVFSRRKIKMLAVLALLFGFGLSGAGGFVSPFAGELLLPFISIYYIAYSTAAVMTRFFGGRVADRFGEDRVIPYAMAMTGGGLLLLIDLHGSGLLAVSGFLTGCGHGLLYPSLNVFALRNEPVEARGKITGIYTGSIDAGIFIGSVLLGWIGELAGYRVLFAMAGAALFAGLGVLKLFEPYRAVPERHT